MNDNVDPLSEAARKREKTASPSSWTKITTISSERDSGYTPYKASTSAGSKPIVSSEAVFKPSGMPKGKVNPPEEAEY